jgi:hypothetical protein
VHSSEPSHVSSSGVGPVPYSNRALKALFVSGRLCIVASLFITNNQGDSSHGASSRGVSASCRGFVRAR